MAGDGTSEGIWGCSVVGAAALVHPWGAGGGTSSLEGRRRRLPTRGALAAALAPARQRDYGGGAVGAVVVGCSDVGCGVGGGGGGGGGGDDGGDSGDDDGGDSGGEGDGGGDCCSKGDGDGSGDDESCRGDGGMSALSVLPLLRLYTMKYQLLSQSHPHLVKMRFLANIRVTAKGFYPTN